MTSLSKGADTTAHARMAQRYAQAARGFSRPRRFSADIRVRFGDTPVLVSVREGRVVAAEIARGPLASWDFSLSAGADAWTRFWQPVPEAGWHDIFALSKRGAMAIEGNLQPLMANLQYVKDLAAAGRGRHERGPDRTHRRPLRLVRHRRPALPRVLRRSRAGHPLVCLHTAGADARQYRHMMNDEAVTSRFRVIAFDLPWHGKSYPPEGWQDEEYQLSTDLYVETVMAFCAALDLSRPALIGCSIGGRIALELAHRHSDRFRALIGVESADYQEPWYDTAWLHRPDVHGGEVCAALVSGLVAPQSPAVHRHETLWQYMQGGPGYSAATCISTAWTAICAAGWAASARTFARCTCSPASTTFRARPKTRCAPRSPYREPRWRSCASWAISP